MFELPECFEAEERSVRDTCDVLQLVSGRTLLGVVREQQLQYLPGIHWPVLLVNFYLNVCCHATPRREQAVSRKGKQPASKAMPDVTS